MADVAMKTLKFHTLHGQAHQIGEVYSVDEADVANLEAQGMATRTDAPAKPAAKPPVSKK